MSAHTALERLDGIRWLHRVAYHLWRIEHHLHLAKEVGKEEEAPAQSDTRKLELDVEED
jgi:phosphate:Na+ symporter